MSKQLDERMMIDEVGERLRELGAHGPSTKTSNLLAFDEVLGWVDWRIPDGGGGNLAWLPKAEAEAFIAKVLPDLKRVAEASRRRPSRAEIMRRHREDVAAQERERSPPPPELQPQRSSQSRSVPWPGAQRQASTVFAIQRNGWYHSISGVPAGVEKLRLRPQKQDGTTSAKVWLTDESLALIECNGVTMSLPLPSERSGKVFNALLTSAERSRVLGN